MQQPLAFLDVDGPLNVYGAGKTKTHLVRREVDLDGSVYTVRLNPNHAKLVRRLSAAGFELVWGTLWEDHANDHLLAWLELDEPLPVVPFSAELELYLTPPECLPPRKFSWQPYCDKAPAVCRYAGDRPFVWFDDDFLGDDDTWAAQRTKDGTPTRLVHVSEETGLTGSHVNQALDWIARLNATKPDDVSV
jgi:hypothetical protein